MTGTELQGQRADGLIVGSVGPFYVALNRATFYLAGGIFLTVAPLLIFLIRDGSTPLRMAVSFGVSLETGTLAHVWMERILDMHGALPWAVHALITAVLFGLIFSVLFR